MAHTTRDKKPLLARVRRIKGQAQALERALEDEAECGAILQQLAAIRGAISGLMAQILEGHLREHVETTTRAPRADMEQVIAALRSYIK
jgi:DNA-binding FrmR family transcriptional regulator